MALIFNLNTACFLHRFPDHLYHTEGLHSPENPMTAVVFRKTIQWHVTYTDHEESNTVWTQHTQS